jgi:hypothetical protein
MNFYELIYLNIYLSISRTNKSIPAWSTLFCLSSLFIFNLLSILTLLNIDIKGLEKNQVLLFAGVIFGIHYLYFQKGNRILQKITRLKPKLNWKIRTLTILYVYGTISLFCYLSNFSLQNYLILIGVLAAIDFINNYVLGKRNKQFD